MNYLPATVKDQDHKIIELKYAAKQIGLMSAEEINLWGRALLMKIHVITGWVIPEGSLLKILIDQFQKKLVESYPNANTEEIEYAFRNYGTVVKDWGKAMNLSLIDEVMIPYLDERKRLSHAHEERNSQPPKQKVYTDEELDNLHRYDAEMFYQRCRRGIVPSCIPEYIREILVKDKLISKRDEAAIFLTNRLGAGFENIYVKDNQ